MTAVINHNLPKPYRSPGEICWHKGSRRGKQCLLCGFYDPREPSVFVGEFKNHLTGEWVEKWATQSEYEELMDAQYMEMAGK